MTCGVGTLSVDQKVEVKVGERTVGVKLQSSYCVGFVFRQRGGVTEGEGVRRSIPLPLR